MNKKYPKKKLKEFVSGRKKLFLSNRINSKIKIENSFQVIQKHRR